MKKTVFLLVLLSSSVQAQLFGAAAISASSPKCGTLSPYGTFKEWTCYNLGAIGNSVTNFPDGSYVKFSDDPSLVPSRPNLKGDYYEWGQKNPVYDRDGAKISNSPSVIYNRDFSSSFDPNSQGDSWADYGPKSPNDPCPAGFRIPTYDEFSFLRDTDFGLSRTDHFSKPNYAVGNYDLESAVGGTSYYSPVAYVSTTFLCMGYYDVTFGAKVVERGTSGYYWSSYYDPRESKAHCLGIINSYVAKDLNTNPTGVAMAVRCTAETELKCGAFMGSNRRFKEWMCYNLGVNEGSPDPHAAFSKNMNGSYYQWGKMNFVANAGTTLSAAWSATAAANSAWTSAAIGTLPSPKNTTNDPCPIGYKVPTKADWDAVLNPAFNTISRVGVGSWELSSTGSDTNFGTAIQVVPLTAPGSRLASTITLTLPAAGYRQSTDGALMARGFSGNYWVADAPNGTTANVFSFGETGTPTTTGTVPRTTGNSVRCIYQY